MMPHALLWHSSDWGDVLWKAKVSLCSLDRLAPRPCGIVGKYLQLSHGNEIAPRQVCDLGVPDLDWTHTRFPSRRIGSFRLSLFSCFFICARKTTQQTTASLLYSLHSFFLFCVFARKMFALKLLLTQTFDALLWQCDCKTQQCVCDRVCLCVWE